MDTEKQKSSPGGTVPGEKVPPVLTAEDVAALEELCGDVSGYFYKMLDYLDQRVRDGVRQGEFTEEQAKADLDFALWYSYACNNLDEYESYCRAAQWMAASEGSAEAARCGIDVFRIFDSLNWVPGMEVAIDEVLNQGKVCEASICYTGDILDPKRDRYTIAYYVDMAKELEKRGAHLLCIKDMSGLLKPYAAKKLVTALKNEVGLPIHLHTHDTSGNQVAALLMAAEAGVDIVDAAIDSMAFMTSQPPHNAVVTALQGQERDTGLAPEKLQTLSDYWADVRLRYSQFEAGIKNPSTDIYRYEMPGGQYTNLKSQVESLGLGHQFEDVKEMYVKVNHMLGDIVKVTPSSKMVGDLAIFMVQNKLDRNNILERGKELTFPRSVVDYFKGMMGQSTFPLPQELSEVVLKGEKPLDTLPSKLLPPADFDAIVEKLRKINPAAGLRQAIAYCLYPQVVEDFLAGYETYGDISQMPSDIFFYGMDRGESMEMSIEEGKTLMIKYIGPGERNDDGTLELQFELNGSRRNVLIRDPHAEVEAEQIRLASAEDKSEIGATIMGAVSRIAVKPGDKVPAIRVLAEELRPASLPPLTAWWRQSMPSPATLSRPDSCWYA